MTSSLTSSTFQSSSTWMTSSYTQTTSTNTENMFETYSSSSGRTTCMLVLTNASSTYTLSNTSDTFSCPTASLWPKTRSKSSKIGWNQEKSKMCNPSSDLQISIDNLSSITLTSQFH